MSSASPTVAVVIPTYNRRDLLTGTLDSIRALERPPDQVIVVSDGSTDGTDEVVRARGISLVTTARAGAAGARNAGWRECSSDVVAFVDDDCIAEPTWLAALSAPFSDPELGLVQGKTIPDGAVGPDDRTIHVASEYGLYESCNIAYRRSALERVGGFNPEFGTLFAGRPFGEDTDLAWRVRRAGWSATFADDAVVRHHVFPGTFLGSLEEEWRKGRFAYMVREIPELRRLLPSGPWFLRRNSGWAQLALLAVPVSIRSRRLALALAAPYALSLARSSHQPAAAGRQAIRDAVASVSLLIGSVRHRSLLL